MRGCRGSGEQQCGRRRSALHSCAWACLACRWVRVAARTYGLLGAYKYGLLCCCCAALGYMAHAVDCWLWSQGVHERHAPAVRLPVAALLGWLIARVRVVDALTWQTVCLLHCFKVYCGRLGRLVLAG